MSRRNPSSRSASSPTVEEKVCISFPSCSTPRRGLTRSNRHLKPIFLAKDLYQVLKPTKLALGMLPTPLNAVSNITHSAIASQDSSRVTTTFKAHCTGHCTVEDFNENFCESRGKNFALFLFMFDAQERPFKIKSPFETYIHRKDLYQVLKPISIGTWDDTDIAKRRGKHHPFCPISSQDSSGVTTTFSAYCTVHCAARYFNVIFCESRCKVGTIPYHIIYVHDITCKSTPSWNWPWPGPRGIGDVVHCTTKL